MEHNDNASCFISNRVLPSVYSDELSYYEQLNKLCKDMNTLIEAFNMQQATFATIKMLNESQDAQDNIFNAKLLDQYNDIMGYTKGEILRLEKLIAEAIAGKVTIFDPTYGIEPRPVEQVIKNVYHWLRYYADIACVIDNLGLTAEERDGYLVTAKIFDLYSTYFYSKFVQQTPCEPTLPPVPPPPSGDYVEKYDILAEYFDEKDN